MKIIKRNGEEQLFDEEKIKVAIQSANKDCTKLLNDLQIDLIVQRVKLTCERYSKSFTVEDVQNLVEEGIMAQGAYEVAKKYITYRYKRKLERDKYNELISVVKEKLRANNVQNQNANVDEYSFSGRMGEATNVISKEVALTGTISKMAKDNHYGNMIYIHDLDHYEIGDHNCLSIPFDDLFANGFEIRQTDIRPARSVDTAFQLLAVIFQLQSLQQFGGVSATHLDHTMIPYVRISFYKHYKKGLKYVECIDDDNEIYTNIHEKMSVEDAIYKSNKKAYKYAVDMTKEEIRQGVEGMFHNLNSLQSRAGGQLPFTSINYGTCTLTEGRWVIQNLLEVNIKGIGKQNRTPIFPCSIFQCMKGVNRKKGEPNYDMYRLALKCTSKRLYPNYANCDWSGNSSALKSDRDMKNRVLSSLSKEQLSTLTDKIVDNHVIGDTLRLEVKDGVLKVIDDVLPAEEMSTMGCHAIDTKIIMDDGSYKLVQDVVVGDKVKGVNGQTRTVESLIRGNGTLFRVDQSRGESYVVNEGHILSLVYSSSKRYRGLKKGDIINISVHDFLKIPESMRRLFKGYKSGYELSDKNFLIPPYILGLWLGDGCHLNTSFSVNKNETHLIDDLSDYAHSINKKINISPIRDENCYNVSISYKETQHSENKFRKGLVAYNLLKNKHIPDCYFYGSKKQREELLSGLLNSDGWSRVGRGRQTVCFANTNLNLIEGVVRLANSLGLTTNVIKARDAVIGKGLCENSILKPYYHVSIHRFDSNLLLDNKRTNINYGSVRNFSTSTIKITKLDAGDFYGFELDGDRLYLINDCTVTHNCRTWNGYDVTFEESYKRNIQTVIEDKPLSPNTLISGAQKDGRGNICPVTIIMPTLAMQAIRKSQENNTDCVYEFMNLLDTKISEAKDSLIERFNWICSQKPNSAKFMYKNNIMAGYIPEEGIRSALKHGTLAIGQLGLSETLKLLIGCDHTIEKGMKLAKRIEALFRDKCAYFKEKYKLNFGVYYTPAENLCYTAMKKFKEKYGVIEGVSDKEYFTNSIHVPVDVKVNAFEKIDIEAQLTGYSSAGCITYIELDSSCQNNIDAVETLVNYAMDKDIPYFAINVPNDQCMNCGYTGDLNDECVQCGSKNIKRLRRVTGYLTNDYKTAFNLGKQQEVEKRVKHM